MPGTYLLIGPPGAGKTTLGCTIVDILKKLVPNFNDVQHPTLIIDADCKADKMYNIRPLVEKGLVDIHSIRSPMIKQSFRDRVLNPDKGLKAQPEGYLEIVDYLNRIIDQEEEFKKYNTYVLDSTTRLCEHLKRLLIYVRGQGKLGKESANAVKGDMNWPAWGSFLANLEEVYLGFLQIPNKNIIVTAHLLEETEHDSITDTDIIKGYWPLIDGQFRKKVAGYFDEVYFLDIKEERKTIDKVSQKVITHVARTFGSKYCARSSLSLPEFIEVEADAVIKSYVTNN